MSNTQHGVVFNVAGERDTKTPVQLMIPVSRSRLGRGLLYSAVAHAALIGLTSFSLYADWAQFGVKMPQELKALKKQQVLSEREARREELQTQAAPTPADVEHDAGGGVEDVTAPISLAVPRVVRDAKAVNVERPTASTLNLDAELGLE